MAKKTKASSKPKAQAKPLSEAEKADIINLLKDEAKKLYEEMGQQENVTKLSWFAEKIAQAKSFRLTPLTESEKADKIIKYLTEAIEILKEKIKIQSAIDALLWEHKYENIPDLVRQKKKNLKKESKKMKAVNEELAKINHKKEMLQSSALLSSTSVPVSALSGNNSAVTEQNHQSDMALTEPVPSPSVSSDKMEENVTTTDSITTVPATDSSTDASSVADVIIPTEEKEPQSKCKIPFSVSQLHHEVQKITHPNHMHRREEIGFRKTVDKDFKAFPVIVRANGREKKCLAVENNGECRNAIQLSPALIEELGMTEKPYKNLRYMKVSISETIVTISSFDDKQTIRVGNEFDKERFCCPPSTRSHYQSVDERWCLHLFGPEKLI